jgi:hypothetical protein
MSRGVSARLVLAQAQAGFSSQKRSEVGGQFQSQEVSGLSWLNVWGQVSGRTAEVETDSRVPIRSIGFSPCPSMSTGFRFEPEADRDEVFCVNERGSFRLHGRI